MRFGSQVPFLVNTKYRASVNARLADLDGNATPTLSLTGPAYLMSSDGTAAVSFAAADADGAPPAVSLTPANAQATVLGDTVLLQGLTAGTHFFTLKAEDTLGKKTFTHFVVDVSGSLPNIIWSPPPVISYGTVLSAAQLNATASVPGTFTYAPAAGTLLGIGSAHTLSVRFTPTDTSVFSTAAKTVTIAVVDGPVFTDDPLVIGATAIKAVHLAELRTAINTLRARYGLTVFDWTDPNLVPGTTAVKVVHVTDLRSALQDVYLAARLTPPAYSTISTASPINAQAINEVRLAVKAIW